MRKEFIATMFVLMLVCLSIPVVLGLPQEKPTDSEIKEIEKEVKSQEAKGWWWKSIPNRYRPEDNIRSHDLVPRLWERGQLGASKVFKVEYAIYSSNTVSFGASWKDRFYLDRDTGVKYCLQDLYQSGEIQRQGYTTGFMTREFTPPGWGLYDMNIDLNINSGISDAFDSYHGNNHDEEYMYFWWVS